VDGNEELPPEWPASRLSETEARNVIASALNDVWGFVPLSLRYDLAREAIEKARPTGSGSA
jgi:hypothetical protein